MLVAESIVVLDLVSVVVCNMKKVEEGRLIVHVNCRKVWELLTANNMKLIQCEGDGGRIIINILALEKKLKLEFDCMHIKTKNDAEELIRGRRKILVTLFDVKAKEERIKYMTEHRNDNLIMKGNIEIKCRNETYDKL